MSRFLFAVFTFMVIFSVATAAKCRITEVYSECGTACQASCKNHGPRPCTTQCVAGCFCKGGLVRNSKGRCIPLAACKCDA